MAIHTRYGSKVEIVGRDKDFPTAPWVYVLREDGSKRWFLVSELRADGGAEELMAAAYAAPVKTFEYGYRNGDDDEIKGAVGLSLARPPRTPPDEFYD